MFASSKIFPLGKMQVNLLLPALIHIFDCVEDTPPQQCSNKFGIVFGLFVSLSSLKIFFNPNS